MVNQCVHGRIYGRKNSNVDRSEITVAAIKQLWQVNGPNQMNDWLQDNKTQLRFLNPGYTFLFDLVNKKLINGSVETRFREILAIADFIQKKKVNNRYWAIGNEDVQLAITIANMPKQDRLQYIRYKNIEYQRQEATRHAI